MMGFPEMGNEADDGVSCQWEMCLMIGSPVNWKWG